MILLRRQWPRAASSGRGAPGPVRHHAGARLRPCRRATPVPRCLHPGGRTADAPTTPARGSRGAERAAWTMSAAHTAGDDPASSSSTDSGPARPRRRAAHRAHPLGSSSAGPAARRRRRTTSGRAGEPACSPGQFGALTRMGASRVARVRGADMFRLASTRVTESAGQALIGATVNCCAAAVRPTPRHPSGHHRGPPSAPIHEDNHD